MGSKPDSGNKKCDVADERVVRQRVETIAIRTEGLWVQILI